MFGHLVEQLLVWKAKYPFRFGNQTHDLGSRFRDECRRVMGVPKKVVCHPVGFFGITRKTENSLS